MKLLKTIGSRAESKSSIRTKQFGLFECPNCKDTVERPLSHGKRNKSCGKKECRRSLMSPTNKQKINPETGNYLIRRTFKYVPKKDNKHKANILYIIRSDKYVKIGVTANLSKRLKILQASNPVKINCDYSIMLDDPFSLEAYLHKKHFDKNVHTEWYELSKDAVSDIVSYISKKLIGTTWEGDSIIEYTDSLKKPKVEDIS